MREERLQSDIAVAFSQRYPKKKGQLFHVSNERNSVKQAYRAKAIGIVAGVADFLFISKKLNAALELKVPGSRHEVAKVRKQIWWGKLWESKGKKNHWRLCRTVEEALSCCEGNLQGMTLKEVEKFLNSVTTKTIKF